MIRKTSLTCSAALLLAIAACSSSTDVSTSLSPSAAAKLAADMDANSTLGPGDVSFNTNGTNTFSVTKQCPKGGQVALSGVIVGTGNQATHSLTVDATANRTDTGCAFDTDNGVVTLTGNLAYTGHLNIVNGALSGLQTQTHKGSFTWARGGVSGPCEVNLSSSYDPATHTATVTGTFCGANINVTRTR
ncbi:MAG: hypothetical protein QOH22_2108 [Gemmatimonadaceae bacterium]|nr:hypothetical protein [Gemmatimonadaceae bacterium]